MNIPLSILVIYTCTASHSSPIMSFRGKRPVVVDELEYFFAEKKKNSEEMMMIKYWTAEYVGKLLYIYISLISF